MVKKSVEKLWWDPTQHCNQICGDYSAADGGYGGGGAVLRNSGNTKIDFVA